VGQNCSISTKIEIKLRQNKNTVTKLRPKQWHLTYHYHITLSLPCGTTWVWHVTIF